MPGRLTGRARLVLAGFGLAGIGIALACYLGGPLRSVEYDSMDARFSIRGERTPPEDIAVVAIDVESFADLQGLGFPFPRRLHARVIDRLREAGARQIAYDVQFTEPTTPAQDNALIIAADRAPHPVFATTEVGANGRTRVFGGDAVLREIGARAGQSEFLPSAGGVFRRVPFELDGLESFAVATVESAEGRQLPPGLMPGGSAWIDYYGPSGTFPYYSFSEVLAGEVPPRAFDDRIVIVGATVSSLQDVHPTPFSTDQLMPGPEIMANAIATVRDGIPLSSTPIGVDVLLIVLIGLLPLAFNLRLAALQAFVAAIAIAAIYVVAAQLAFNSGRIIPVVYPLLGLAVASVGGLGTHYLMEAFQRQRTRDAFGRFVPDAVVDELLGSTEEIRLGGRRFEATALFSDIRGFTTFSESRPPEEVLEILNRYLGEMTEAILDHGGTLMSFMGDGIHAVFGAPVELPDHADRALAAAREMLGPRLETFNRWAKQQGIAEPFRMGIGINSGPMMAGQVGSERRLDYTAIGDTVNTASRLEGMTKGTRHQLFLADSTRSRLHQQPEDLVHVDEMPVRGRSGGISVWAISVDERPIAGDGWQ